MGTLLRSATVSVVVDAPPAAVWEVVGDPTRTGEWSHECTTVTFVDGATAARPGARFRGRNRVGRTGWTRTCEIVAIDEGRSITWRTIPTRVYRDSTTWSITVEPVDEGGTKIEEHYEVTEISPVMERLIWRFIPVHRDRREALTADLQRIGDVARPQPGDGGR